MEIRYMRAGDIEPICVADDDVTDEFRAYLNRQLDNQRNGECSALVAVCGGEMAGHMFLYHDCRCGGCANQGLPCVVDLKVFERYRRRGVADALMDEAENLAAQSARRIYLDVGLNSEYGAAQRLYAKRGYLPDGRGVYYDQRVCDVGELYANDDRLTLCLIKELSRP